MRTPIRPVPEPVSRWVSRIRWLRWVDAVVAWIALWAVLASVLGPGLVTSAGVIAWVVLCLALFVRPLRVRWRPITGWVSLTMSRDLRAGDRAWYVGPRDATLVIVTARHGLRLVIARPDLADEEGMSLRRTRVLLLPADGGG